MEFSERNDKGALMKKAPSCKPEAEVKGGAREEPGAHTHTRRGFDATGRVSLSFSFRECFPIGVL